MSLAPGTRLGPFEIIALIGSGGMGQVYRATDVHLKRSVAIKVLPDAVAADPERLARFQREAELLAALNHPNVAHVHGLEKSAGTTALVMELVDGPTLEDLIGTAGVGGMPIADALPIARQIAEALEAAHDQGIVHRDLKPANVKIRADGTVKVLDFGLAKALDANASGATADVANSPTLTNLATELGTILGTAAYMAPEQARGKPVDKRADIWAFGVVVYEMVTGRRLFPGREISDVLAAVLRQDIDWTALPAGTPPRLRRLLERCLDRDAKTRLRDIGEARIEIARIEAGAADAPGDPAPALAAPRRGFAGMVPWIIAGAAVIVAAAQGVFRHPAAAGDTRVARLPLMPPDNVALDDFSSTVVSPDGMKVLFSGRAPDGRRLLWVRALDALDAQPLPETDDAIEAFWSPDSRSVAFGAQGKLKRVDLAGGHAQILTDAARLVGGAWSPAGVIVFAPDYRTPLARVPANGGAHTPATRFNVARGEGGGDRYPVFLPDGRHFLYSSGRNVGIQAIMVGSLDSIDAKELVPNSAPAVYASPGWLLYARNGTIVAQAFDTGRLDLSGEPRTIGTAPVATWAAGGRFSLSRDGVMVLQNPQAYDYQLTWFDRAGQQVGALGPVVKTSLVEVPRISPDGRHVVVQRLDLQTRNQDLWIGDVTRGTFDRFTTDPAQEQLPVWSADGQSVICSTARNGGGGIFQFPVTGGDGQLMLKGTVFPSDVSPDGKWLFYGQRGETTRSDIWALPLSSAQPTSTGGAPHVVVQSEFDDAQAQISPNGQWLAYVSDVSAVAEVYVRRLTAEGTVARPHAFRPMAAPSRDGPAMGGSCSS